MSSDDSPDTRDSSGGPPSARQVATLIDENSFADWYRQQQFEENIRNGQAYFNGPPSQKPPKKVSPSELLKCQRKIYYKHQNAPVETKDPDGIFFFGTHFEEEVAEEFLDDVVGAEGMYLRNSMWVDFDVETDDGPVQVRGSTDPVIVDEESEPVLLTEIKTTGSLNLTEPRRHHLAQAHAYMEGLSRQYDREVRDVVLLYAERDTLEVKMFHEQFDVEFWQQVTEWMHEHKWHQMVGLLPQSDPEYNWECDYCDYQERCGEGQNLVRDLDTKGLVPGYTDYPKQKVREYLQANTNQALTPSLAHEYPSLADEFEVCDWICEDCKITVRWEKKEPKWGILPDCPECGNQTGAKLTDPDPGNQHITEADNEFEGTTR